MGDGGPRDNFAYGDRERQLTAFLDFVEQRSGRLVICGDLFELWQSNISKVLTHRKWLLDRLAKMQTTYVLGNHDSDLYYFMLQEGWLTHPFFHRMCGSCYLKMGGKTFHFIHGHEADPYCASDVPGLGRITAIYSGLAEDRNGGPMLDKYNTVEQKVHRADGATGQRLELAAAQTGSLHGDQSESARHATGRRRGDLRAHTSARPDRHLALQPRHMGRTRQQFRFHP